MILLSRTLGVPLWMPYSTLGFVYSLVMVLIIMILRGKRWARLFYTVFGVLGIFSVFGHLADISAAGWLAVATKALAVALLYAPASNSWFAGSSPNNSFKSKPIRGVA